MGLLLCHPNTSYNVGVKQQMSPVPSPSGPRSSDPGPVRAGQGSGSTLGGGIGSLSELVAARRAELGLSLRALGERSGIHYSHLSKVEHGADSAGIGALAGLSRGLELPLSELLRAAGVRANLGLPSFAGYLDAVAPTLAQSKRQELEVAYERLTSIEAAAVPEAGEGSA